MQASPPDCRVLLFLCLLSAAATADELSGTITLSDAAARGFQVHEDRFDYAANNGNALRTFPAIRFDIVQDGQFLLPVEQGIRDVGHPNWEIALQPGLIWPATQDTPTRAALPLALIERNANCTHNGVLSWHFAEDGELSEVLWQVTGETCAYFKFDMWGTAVGGFRNATFSAAGRTIDRYRAHRAARLPVRTIERIGERFPGADAAAFGPVGDMLAKDMTVYGFIIDGVHYRGGCGTRHGPYPFCDELLLPSYSIAKSLFAGLAFMRLERLMQTTQHRRISSLVPECSEAEWGDVTIEQALDMTTGHYDDTGLEVDEASEKHVGFLYAETHDRKIRAACTLFPRQAAAGERFVYHTSDTYIAGTAMQALWREMRGSDADIYDTLLVESIWDELHLSEIAGQTRRTYDDVRQPWAGWGLTFIADDIVRVANWLNSGEAKVDGEPMFDPRQFRAAMQRDPDDRGLPAPAADFRYNNGFWAHDIAGYIGCSEPVWVPFMSGYGGISIVLFPNGTTYYYFSDGYTQRWREAAVAAHHLKGMCR